MHTNKLRFVESEDHSVTESKARLRAYAKERRACNENRDVKEELINKNFFKVLAAIQNEKGQTAYPCTSLNVFVYLSYSSEAPTDKLIDGLLERGCKVFCPRLENGQMSAVEYGEDFSVNAYGIREPVGEAYQGEMDIIVTPLLAADQAGHRLGYGGGYYDRYFQTQKTAKRVGYCYDFQIINNVPTTDGDERLHMLVTDKRIAFIAREEQS